MKFYLCRDKNDYTFDCTTTLKEATQLVKAQGYGEVQLLDVPVTAATICALLGNHGGYADKVGKTWQIR